MSKTQSIRTKPEPSCPDCGARMVLRRPRSNQDWEPFWGCGQYPECRGTRQIRADGTPEDDDWLEDFELPIWGADCPPSG